MNAGVVKVLVVLGGLLSEGIRWSREAWRRRNAQHDEAVRKKADIDARHVERPRASVNAVVCERGCPMMGPGHNTAIDCQALKRGSIARYRTSDDWCTCPCHEDGGPEGDP